MADDGRDYRASSEQGNLDIAVVVAGGDGIIFS